MTATDTVEPIDSDIDLRVPAHRRELTRSHALVLLVISLGGGIGAVARYGLAVLLPTVPGHFPWATFLANVLGCLLIGVLMVLITEIWSAHRLLRPFLGVGVLGGFTTFSTYAVEVRGLLRPGSVPVASDTWPARWSRHCWRSRSACGWPGGAVAWRGAVRVPSRLSW